MPKTIVNCAQCGKEKHIYPSQLIYKNYFCSMECRGKWNSAKYVGANNPRYSGGKSGTCAQCGEGVWIKPSRLNRDRHFCSKKCVADWQSENTVGENSSNWKGGPVNCTCPNCNAAFTVLRAEHERGGGKYCSMTCSSEAKKKQVEMVCEVCGKHYHKRAGAVEGSRYCSVECLYAAQRKSTSTSCCICGQPIRVIPSRLSRNGRNFCGIDCRKVGFIGSFNPAWIGGNSFEPYPTEWRRTLKVAIRERDNYTCQLCGISQEKNGRLLDVHHIDYNKDNLNESNLVSLCHSCHAKTNHNREHWQEYFRRNKAPSKVLSQ